jgi:hypothetical protein
LTVRAFENLSNRGGTRSLVNILQHGLCTQRATQLPECREQSAAPVTGPPDNESQVHAIAIRGLELDRPSEPEHDCGRRPEVIDRGVWDCYPLTDSRRAEPLAVLQSLPQDVSRDTGTFTDVLCGLSEKRSLGLNGRVEKYIFVTKDLSETDSFRHLRLRGEGIEPHENLTRERIGSVSKGSVVTSFLATLAIETPTPAPWFVRGRRRVLQISQVQLRYQ